MSSMLETGSEGPKKSRVRSESIVISEVGGDTNGNDLGLGGGARVMAEVSRCGTCYRVGPQAVQRQAHKCAGVTGTLRRLQHLKPDF